MTHNPKKYINKKFKVMFGNMKSPTMYAELHNGKHTKTFQNEIGEIISEFITIEEQSEIKKWAIENN